MAVQEKTSCQSLDKCTKFINKQDFDSGGGRACVRAWIMWEIFVSSP